MELLQLLMPSRLLQPILKPLTRLILGVVAVPLFRLFLHRVVRVREISDELEKDLEQWFRGALLLLLATRNMEGVLFGWVSADVLERKDWMFMAGRVLLAIGVIESMPDQALFSLIHPGPPKPNIEKGKVIRSVLAYLPQLLRGLLCRHLSRSSPMFAILAAVADGEFGWICYGMAIAQYLIIGLVTSRDRALDVLQRFDAAVAQQRTELEAELRAGGPIVLSQPLPPASDEDTNLPAIDEQPASKLPAPADRDN